jgi:hypothetical protein
MAINKTKIDNDGEIINVILTQFDITTIRKEYETSTNTKLEYAEDLSKFIQMLISQQLHKEQS